ncbi:amino acid permease [Acidianus sulfidivorans JP7]|uniref:APC family permease n=1 Tax=Acidianus sulfidivorans JP7 TaxID=619593 RepID=A0A2U9IL11_9CREN|nr:APC family permease [Acidianus sulfidivorans]AWR96707.1 amino acid permease [Acidianus sulfidivorans JP7]
MAQNKGLFIRESSGLVREVSPWASLSATFGLVTGGVPILILSWLFTSPGANWVLSFLLMLPPTLGMAFLFYVAGISMPRSGGDYVFNSRAVHPVVGFLNYFGLFVAFGLSLGYYSYLAAQWFGYLFSGLGLAYNNSLYLSLGNWFSSTEGSVIVGIIVVIFSIILSVLPRVQWRFIFWGGVITLLTSIVMFSVLLQIHPSAFSSALASSTGIPNAYSQVISYAESNGLHYYPVLYATILAGPVIWYYYTWYNLPASWAGEMKQVRKNVLYSIVVALLIIFVYYSVFTYLSLHAFGYDFMTSWSYISNNGLNDTVYNNLASIGDFTPYFALIVNHNILIYLIMFIALWLPNFYSNPPLVTSLVRYLFSWSFDRIIPEKFADVNDKLRAPVKATIVVGAIGIAGVLLYALNTVVALVDVTVIFEIGYAIFALSAALMPFLRKAVYERTVPIRKKVAGIPVISWIGFAVFAFLLFILAYTWGNPVLLPINSATLGSLVIIYAIGAGIFAAAKYANKRKGIDISLLFQEIPPE